MKQLRKEYKDLEGLELATICSRIAQDNKGEDVITLDVRELSSFTDFFVVLSGRSTRHVQALAESIENELRSKRIKTSSAEGLQEGNWVLLDFGDVIVHIFYHDQRKFYDLEGLWHEAPRIDEP